jgi:class 3 adenylate cyclase
VAAQAAAGSAARQPGRLTLTAAGLTLGLSLIIFFAGYSVMVGDFFAYASESFFAADFVLIRPMPPGTSFQDITRLPAYPPFDPELQAALDDLQTRADVGYLANISLPGLGLETGAGDQYGFALTIARIKNTPLFPVAEGSWDEAEKIFAAGPALIAPEIVARRDNLHPGDTVEVETLRGRVPFTVALVGGGFPVVNHKTAQEYLGSYPAFILVNARGDKAALRTELQALARQHNLLLAEDMAKEVRHQMNLLLAPIVGLFIALTSLVGVVAGLGVVVTLLASVLERQRELGTLRALGMSRAQVRGMIVVEAGLIGLAGSGVGVLGGLLLAFTMTRLFVGALEAAAGLQLTTISGLPWPVALGALVVGPGITMLTALWPADRAASVNPAEAMRAEGAMGFLKPAQHLGPVGLRGLLARTPLSAKLSLTIGLLFIATIGALTGVRVNQERRLLEDNVRSLMQRGFTYMAEQAKDQLPAPDITELTPATLAALQAQAGTQAAALSAQFQGGASPYEFGLKYFVVLNQSNKVITSDMTEFIGQVVTDTVAFSGADPVVRLTRWTGERVFEAAWPIANSAGKPLGSVRVGFSTEPVDNIIRDIVRGSVLAVAVALVAAVSLTIFFTRRALAPVGQIAEAAYSVARGDLTRRVSETRWDDLGRLERAFNDMVKGLNEREQIREMFGRYVSPQVREAIESGRVTLTGERKTVTVLYCDMRGSTPFAEAHEPEEVMAALNQYFEVIILATEAHGGIVNRFVGDAAVCVFGAPTEYRDHAERAVEAALSMREGLAHLNRKRTLLGLPTLLFGLGLNTGAVTAGATGSEERQEYTLIGDAMNLGARIEELNKVYPEHDILLSEFTHSALGDKAQSYAFNDLGPVDIRGKALKVRVLGLARRAART